MAFLRINGWEVPGAVDSLGLGQDDTGEDARSVNGYLHAHRLFDADVLAGQLATSSPVLGAAFRGLVKGRGARWAFDREIAFVPSRYSSKGLPATTWTGAVGHETEVVVYDYSAKTPTLPKLGTSCLGVNSGTTNLFSGDVASCTTSAAIPAGISAVDAATLASDTGTFREGTRSLKVTTSAAVNGTRGGVLLTTAGAVAGATLYTGSVYLRAASGTPSVRVYMSDGFGGVGASKTVQLSSSAWKRVVVQVTTNALAGDTGIYVVEDTADAGIAFFCDMAQVERKDAVTGWATGATTRAASDVTYRLAEHRGHDDLTVMCWARRDMTGYDSGGVFFIYSSLGQYVELVLNDTSATVNHVGDGGDSVSSPGGGIDSLDWHHYAVTLERRTGNVKFYIDGAYIGGNLASTAIPPLATPILKLGYDYAGSFPLEGQVDELVVVPWCATADQLAAWYARGAFSDLPELLVAGTCISGDALPEVAMLGRIDGDSFRSGVNPDTSTLDHGLRAMSFTLTERGQ